MKSLVLMALWFGIVTGLVEGFGLLLFQRLSWERWGAVLHVTAPILWISVALDVVFFIALALAIAGLAALFARIPATRTTVFVLTTLAVFDWLILTERLQRRSCWLLAAGVAAVFVRWMSRRELQVLRFWKRTLPWMVAAAVTVLAVVQGSAWLRQHYDLARLPAARPGAPNVLVIVVDTLRADHLSSYGYMQPTSPNVDRLAREGVLFEKAVSASSWTFPSHVSLVTGRYVFEHGVGKVPRGPLLFGGQSDLGGTATIGEVLGNAGYRTAAFSANRAYFVGNLGFSRGFSYFADYFDSVSDMLARTVCGRELRRVYVKRIDPSLAVRAARVGTNYGVRKSGIEINRELLQWLDQDNHHPFFAFVNFFDVHDPYGGPAAMPGQVWDIAKYDQSIQTADQRIGELMKALHDRRLDRNTLVVVTSDHGESLGEHGMQGHGRTLYWNLIHVPLVIWYPGHVPAGMRISPAVSNVALASTIATLAGVRHPLSFLGPPLSELWEHPQSAATWPEPLSELARNGFLTQEDPATDQAVPTWKAGPLRSLVASRWHLIVHKTLGDQLYDWNTDPQERNNLINTVQGQDIARALVRNMNDVLARSPSEPPVFATDLADGASTFRMENTHDVQAPVNYFRVRADPGSTVTVQVRAELPKNGNKKMDPMIAIENRAGVLYGTCFNPGDDKIPPPGVSDPTPKAADDVCVNDDASPGYDTASQLDMLVPGKDDTPVELYVRVSDWNGNPPPRAEYDISVSDTSPTTHQHQMEKR